LSCIFIKFSVKYIIAQIVLIFVIMNPHCGNRPLAIVNKYHPYNFYQFYRPWQRNH